MPPDAIAAQAENMDNLERPKRGPFLGGKIYHVWFGVTGQGTKIHLCMANSYFKQRSASDKAQCSVNAKNSD